MNSLIELFKKNKCVYCYQELDKELWNSRWDSKHHYKVISCCCGKKNWLKIDFEGSGHDFLFKKELSPLESTVRKVREKC